MYIYIIYVTYIHMNACVKHHMTYIHVHELQPLQPSTLFSNTTISFVLKPAHIYRNESANPQPAYNLHASFHTCIYIYTYCHYCEMAL